MYHFNNKLLSTTITIIKWQANPWQIYMCTKSYMCLPSMGKLSLVTLGNRSINTMAMKLWNSLPKRIRDVTTIYTYHGLCGTLAVLCFEFFSFCLNHSHFHMQQFHLPEVLHQLNFWQSSCFLWNDTRLNIMHNMIINYLYPII